MTGKALLLQAIQNKPTPRPAWVPFVGVHGGQITHVDATAYLQNPEAILAGLREARKRYKPDGLPVVFDLQIEAEILGCDLSWAPKGPPAVTTHPLEMGTALSDLPAFDTTSGRFPIVKEVLEKLVAEMGSEVAIYGLITGPFTLALHLMGPNIFLAMFDEPELVHEVLAFCCEVGRKTAAFYLDHGADVIAVVDPMTSQISPEHFVEFVAPYMNPIFDDVRSRGAFSSIFVCGDATRNLEVMAATRCDNMSVDENIDLAYLRDIARANGKSVGGNLKLTVVLLLGGPDDSRLDAIRCIETCGSEGFILAPGCDLPYDVPAENLEAVAEMVHDDYKRQVAQTTLKAPELDLGSFDRPNYDDEADVVIDVITLNSETCAPCQYMMDAVNRAVSVIGSGVRAQEHKITTKEGLCAMVGLGVGNLPTICIDGDPKFVSLIPDQDTLVAAIRDRMAQKARR